MMLKRILFVDDDWALGQLLKDYLSRFDFDIDITTKPQYALKKVTQQPFDAAIVDVMMPVMDGFEWIRQVRNKGLNLPIIMLTARGETADRILGLETGADDYLPKPFEPRELAARLHSLIRRCTHTDASLPSILNFDALCLNFDQRGAYLLDGDNETLIDAKLTTGEFNVLGVLAKKRPQVVSRDALFAQLRGVDFDCTDRSLDIMISRIRAKLKDNATTPRYIKTFRNIGYAFIANNQ